MHREPEENAQVPPRQPSSGSGSPMQMRLGEAAGGRKLAKDSRKPLKPGGTSPHTRDPAVGPRFRDTRVPSDEMKTLKPFTKAGKVTNLNVKRGSGFALGLGPQGAAGEPFPVALLLAGISPEPASGALSSVAFPRHAHHMT